MEPEVIKQRTFDFGIRCANYRAAWRARSRADFIAKMGIVEEECDEAIYWSDVLVATDFLKQSRRNSLKHGLLDQNAPNFAPSANPQSAIPNPQS